MKLERTNSRAEATACCLADSVVMVVSFGFGALIDANCTATSSSEPGNLTANVSALITLAIDTFTVLPTFNFDP